jgi:hypothetical protein
MVAIVHPDADVADGLQLVLEQADIPAYTVVLSPTEPAEAALPWLRPETGLVVVGITTPLERSQRLLQLLCHELGDAPRLALSPMPAAVAPRLGAAASVIVQLSPDFDETAQAVLTAIRWALPPAFALRLRARHARAEANRLLADSLVLYQRGQAFGAQAR